MKYTFRLVWPLISLVSILLFSSFSEETIRFQKIDMHAGLSYNSVLCVIQDHEQFLWIGTRDGLNKYNSLDFEIYKHDINDSLSLSHSHINCIYETANHEIWVGTAKGLNKYNRAKNNFHQYLATKNSTGLSNEYVKCISEDTEGCLWIGTSYGINKYNPKNDRFEHILLSDSSTSINNIVTLFHDNRNRLWIGTLAGLYIKDKESFIRIDFDPGHKSSELFEIRDIKENKNGQMWIATEKHGVFSFFLSNGIVEIAKVFNKVNDGLVSNSVRKILVDGDRIWLATLDGLAKLDSDGKITNSTFSIDQPEGISNSSIHDIIKDHFGGYWLATYTEGLNYYNPQNNLFQHLESILGVANGLKSNVVSGFVEDENQNIWIATGSGGLSYWNVEENRFTNFTSNGNNSISSNITKCISADKTGNLWIGTYNGLNFYNCKTKTFTNFFHDAQNPNSLNFNQVHAVHVDKNGMVWIGMNGGVFQLFNPNTNRFTSIPAAGKIVDAIFEDSSGRLWIGERYGLRCIDSKTKEPIDISRLTQNINDQLKYINYITEDSSNRLWIATQGSGIMLILSEKVYWFNKNNGLSDNTINAIVEDENGFLWISTNKGISKLKFSFSENGSPKISSVDFTEAHGLQGKQFEKGSALKTSSGRILFGGINGINIVYPRQIEKLSYYPPVVLSEFKVIYESGMPQNYNLPNNQLINDVHQLVLTYKERNIYLRFAGINFIDPTATYYRYKIAGPDKMWINLDQQRAINFTYLPVGKHELQIQASSNNTNWGNEYKSLEIIVLPPWWLTWWAYIFYGLLLLVLFYIIFYYSQKWANLKHSLSMEHFKREQELELHESKIRFFIDVSHELRTPLTLILAPLERIMLNKGINEEVNRQLLIIRRNGNRMMQLINQVLNLRKLETGHDKLQAAEGDFVLFLKEISLAYNEVAKSRDINFKFVPAIEPLFLWFDRDKMESVIYNLLSNAFKNTPDRGNIVISLKIRQPELIDSLSLFKKVNDFAEICISNSGKGIHKEDLDLIFDRFYSKKQDSYVTAEEVGTGVGLELTRRLVQLHKGNIEVESIIDPDNPKLGNTKFIVSIPMGKAHLSEDEINHNFKNSDTLSLYTQDLLVREKVMTFETEESKSILPKVSDIEKQTLLVIEDNIEVRQFIRDLFRENYIVEEAGNGKSGWEKAIDIVPDLIISDVMMPEMDGIELCSKLKTDVRTSHIPVILLSARPTLTFKYEGIETGADEYIIKPFSAEYLIIRVKNLIRQRDMLRSYYARQAILEPKDVTVTSVDERFLKKAVDFITEHIEDSSINVETLSKELGLSRVHFYRKIKALTNLTAVDFIRSIRLKRAAILLQKNKLSIKEIHNMVGFENADYFRICFKSQFGMTPSEYASNFMNSQKE
ncbi:MAG: response regulator [Bacteroidales bacterium]|nr:response regulator [Bacteroidales bacterium]